jgi:hypothetical protein
MSLEHSDWVTGNGPDIDPVERQKHEDEGWAISGRSLQEYGQRETERMNKEIRQARDADEAAAATGNEDMAAGTGSSDGRASTPGYEDSVGAGEDGAKDDDNDNETGNCEARGGEATEESGGELGESEAGHGEYSDHEHSHTTTRVVTNLVLLKMILTNTSIRWPPKILLWLITNALATNKNINRHINGTSASPMAVSYSPCS